MEINILTLFINPAYIHKFPPPCSMYFLITSVKKNTSKKKQVRSLNCATSINKNFFLLFVLARNNNNNVYIVEYHTTRDWV